MRRACYRTSRGFSILTLQDTIRGLGLQQGDVVMVHVSMRRFKGFRGTPYDVIDVLLDTIGLQGTLLMPSMPFQSSAVDFVKSGIVLDVRSTESKMGIVTELFRRCPETQRSLHPTHPILAQGAKAERMLADHLKVHTPCGHHSPFDNLLQEDGQILLLGSGINTNTFYHYLEEVFEERQPSSPLTGDTYQISVIDHDGRTHTIFNRLYDPIMSRMRNQIILEEHMKAVGMWRESQLGDLQIILLRAKDVYVAMEGLLEKGMHCYVGPQS